MTTRDRLLLPDLLVLAGLAGLAITQPVLDLLGRNAEFFVYANLRPLQIVLFAVAVAVVPPLALWLGEVIASRVRPSAVPLVHSVAVGLLTAVLTLGLLRHADVDSVVIVALLGLGAAVGVALLERRAAPVRLLLRYLAAANVAFVVLFLFASPAADVIRPSDADLGRVTVPPVHGPVVFVILDEFPLSSIITPEGRINDRRFPNFARLAERATWFRNSASVSSATHLAVPAMLSGKTVDEDLLPTYAAHPRNLFTMLHHRVPVHAYELVTSMCPPRTCGSAPAGSLGQAFHDAAVVFGHQELPASVRAHLPPIDTAWGGFVTGDAEPSAPETPNVSILHKAYEKWRRLGMKARGPRGQVAALRSLTDAIGPEPALSFIHVALPHAPWRAAPNGWFNSGDYRSPGDPTGPNYAFRRRQGAERHFQQAMVADEGVGHLIDHLDAIGAWDDTLLVVTSDHGTSLLGPDYGRSLTPNNIENVLRQPLFFKLPGQKDGVIRDDVASTLDVLPSIADLLDVKTDWKFDGHSLFDGSRPKVERRVGDSLTPLFEAARRMRDLFGGTDADGLAAVGDHADLVTHPVSSFEVGSLSTMQGTIDHYLEFAHLPQPSRGMPFLVTGSVDSGDDPPPELLVAVNGTVVGTTGGYERGRAGRWKFSSFVADRYHPGHNTIQLFEVETSTSGTVLHRIRP